MSFNESRHKNTYIDKKINESITALLNEMEVLVDNTHDEDVTLPQLLDKLYGRVIENTKRITEISSGNNPPWSAFTKTAPSVTFCFISYPHNACQQKLH